MPRPLRSRTGWRKFAGGLVSVAALLVASTTALADPTLEVVAPDLTRPIESAVPVITVRMPTMANPGGPTAWQASLFLTVRIDGQLFVKCHDISGVWGGGEKVSGQAYVRQSSAVGDAAVHFSPNQQVAAVAVPQDIQGSCGLEPAQFRQGPPNRLGPLAPGSHLVEFGLYDYRGQQVASKTASFTYRPVAVAKSPLIYENAVHRVEIFGGGADQPGIGALAGGPGLEQYTGLTSPTSFTRVGRVSGRNMVSMTARAMARYLETAINVKCGRERMIRREDPYCIVPLVAVDEITPQFRDWTAAERADAGKDSPGARLSQAIRLLKGTTAPWGSPYADAVQLYIAGSVLTDIAGGGGNTYRSLYGALRGAGGTWLEMYTGSAGTGARSFTASQWGTVPAAVHRATGSTGNLHFVMTSASRLLRRAGCTDQMSCQWAWARSSATNQAILANRPGTYRAGDQAPSWLANYNAIFAR